MSNKILIDASHPEETRVVVTKGNRIEEFDFESEHKKQLKGNIYLARVTRVEPSLQAAFVEYGGNRHGFLAFSEIHPDYYQLPTHDRQVNDEADHTDNDDKSTSEHKEITTNTANEENHAITAPNSVDDNLTDVSESAQDADEHSDDDKPVDLVGAEDALEEVPARDNHKTLIDWRDYKIQEVIKRRQILLVQVVKEERGNKGAALTTYLSLAGRYSVLMPNTARGGGISRKITNPTDRKRLKDIVKDLSVPEGMGIILRTAGASRTKAEVRRDYEYLMRLWENVRTLTMSSMAPALVYEEGSLIKRSIRDLYNKNIDEVLVAGEKGYREAKDFMRMLMPSHAKFVQPYKELTPIFARQGIEAQLDSMLQPEADLKSGGYLVINQTEALVAIDVNSGRSTKEHSIEETALQTNLEAAEEVARQLRLRDLAGLIVIDFIDMQEKRNIRAIEKKLKDCLKDDRARIQVGRISHFGLMEMSRQRIRASVLESTTQPCPHCFGQGYVRSESSLALHVLRMVEEYLQNNHSHSILVRTLTPTALYVLNHKRRALSELEERFGLTIDIEADDSLGQDISSIQQTDEIAHPVNEEKNISATEEKANNKNAVQIQENSDPQKEQGKKRGRKAKPRNQKETSKHQEEQTERLEDKEAINNDASENKPQDQLTTDDSEDNSKRRRRRGRRGGRRNREQHTQHSIPNVELVGPIAQIEATARDEAKQAKVSEKSVDSQIPDAEPVALTQNKAPKKRKNTPRKKKVAEKNATEHTSQLSSQEGDTEDNTTSNTSGKKTSQRKKTNKTKQPKKQNSAQQITEADPQIITATEDSPKKTETTNKTVFDKELSDTSSAVSKRTSNLEDNQRDSIKRSIQTNEPVVTSSTSNGEEEQPKKRGWWGRKGFF